jgi:hypothetical protein
MCEVTLNQDHSVSKSNLLHVDISQFVFINLEVCSIDSSKRIGDFLIFSNSDRLFVIGGQHSPFIGTWLTLTCIMIFGIRLPLQ